MHRADLLHGNVSLRDKLQTLYNLRRTRSAVNWDRCGFLDLLECFDNPHLKLPPIIHVAGTNGKGSIISILRAILEAAGKNVHAYTSPHLVNVNERIYLGGELIKDDYLEELIDRSLRYNQGAPLSFFEITTAIAFEAFSKIPADILLLEVGMGGRLDCTNVIENPLISIISKISLDHTDFLGDTFEKIAAEKAGIIKRGSPCIIGNQGDDNKSSNVYRVLEGKAKSEEAPCYIYGRDWGCNRNVNDMIFSYQGDVYKFPLPSLFGDHQIHNAGAALAALFTIKDYMAISHEAMAKGLQNARWPGRLQKLPQTAFNITGEGEIWLDSGHNDSAGQALADQAKQWAGHDGKNLHVVIGLLGRKDARGFLTPLKQYIFGLHIVPISSDPTSQSEKDIRLSLDGLFDDIKTHSHKDFLKAIECIVASDSSANILIAGSIYLAGEVLEHVETCD